MGRYLEAGLAKALGENARQMGREAAAKARSQLRRFPPSLAIVFVSAELDFEAVQEGVSEILPHCPTIGTSTAGEICNGPVTNGVVVALLASRHLRVRVGMGSRVSADFTEAVREALSQAGILDYFDSGHPFHHMMSISAPGIPGVSSALMIVFSPGATKRQPSLSHDIHTYLRRYSANRIPIFGGSSGDYFRFESNRQMANGVVSDDAIALAFIESEVLFGLGLAHGFSPTRKGALITRASGHVVYELDGRPAAEVLAEILGVPLEELSKDATWFSRFPFGSTDVYGNSILQVPERILDDKAVQFGPIMNIDQMINLMSCTEREVAQAGLSAYKKAVRQAGLSRPTFAFMFSCALRKRLVTDTRDEIDPILSYCDVPLCGFYTFGEKGLSDDGLPVYCNQSVSMLVFSDELNPVAALVHKGTDAYREFLKELHKKEYQIRAIGKINQLIQDASKTERLLRLLTAELAELLPWADSAFYIPGDASRTYRLSCASDEEVFPEELSDEKLDGDFLPIWMESAGKRFGFMLVKNRDASLSEEDDLIFAQTIARLTAGGLHRMELDARVELKLDYLAILNRVGRELSAAVSYESPSHHILAYLTRILNASFGSLWLIDQSNQLLLKEAFEGDRVNYRDQALTMNDERIARWQMTSGQPRFFHPPDEPFPGDLITPFPFSFASIPLEFRGKLRGILNLYFTVGDQGLFRNDQALETMDLLTSLSAQIVVFMENLSLQKHATLYKEVHHRIKNNLHNIAGLLRMQIRRLNRGSAEQALTDSITRIMSIAKVHETLSQTDIGMIDLGRLVGRVSTMALSDGPMNHAVAIDVSGSPILVPSKEATSIALVVNELVQNARKHGVKKEGNGSLSIRLTHANGVVELTVQDDGPGLPEGFDAARHANLGLTIVNTVVKEELKGEFVIEAARGTRASIHFPMARNQEPPLGGRHELPSGLGR